MGAFAGAWVVDGVCQTIVGRKITEGTRAFRLDAFPD